MMTPYWQWMMDYQTMMMILNNNDNIDDKDIK